jgi:hypothetical protein
LIKLPADTLAVLEALETEQKAESKVTVVHADKKRSGSMAKSFVMSAGMSAVAKSTVSKKVAKKATSTAVKKPMVKRKANKRKKLDEKVMDAYVRSYFQKPLSVCSTMEYAWAKSVCGM